MIVQDFKVGHPKWMSVSFKCVSKSTISGAAVRKDIIMSVMMKANWLKNSSWAIYIRYLYFTLDNQISSEFKRMDIVYLAI